MQGQRGPHSVAAYVYAVADRAQIYAERGEFARAQRDFAPVVDVLGGERPAVPGSLLTKRAGAGMWLGDYAGPNTYARAAPDLGLHTSTRNNVVKDSRSVGVEKYVQ